MKSSLIERFWNIVYYFAYRADYKLHMAYSKIEPVGILLRLLFLVPFIRKAYQKKGVTIETINKRVDDAFKRPDIGLSSIFAGGLMYGLPIFFFTGVLLFCIAFSSIKPKKFGPVLVVFISYSVISFLFTYILLFHKDKYLKYFKEFDKKPRKWKIKWAWISLGVILFPLIFLALSFIVMSK